MKVAISGHPSRLARDFGRKAWGNEGYAQEELVAELASAFLYADLELTPEVHEDHSAYLAHWQTKLKNDKRFLLPPPLMPSARLLFCIATDRRDRR